MAEAEDAEIGGMGAGAEEDGDVGNGDVGVGDVVDGPEEEGAMGDGAEGDEDDGDGAEIKEDVAVTGANAVSGYLFDV